MNITKGKVDTALKCCIYGPEGIGKSTFASMFPEPLFIDTEGSTKHMDVARFDKPTSWTMLNQQVAYVKRNKGCKTLVIDTIDWAERLAIEFVCSKSSKESITGFGYGEGFIQLEEEFGRFLNSLSDLIEMGINVVLTAHAKINKFEQPDEMGAYDRYELKLGNKTTAKTSSLVKEWADMVLFANYKTYSVATDKDGKKHKAQGGQRVMYTTHHPCWDAKNRHDLMSELPFDFSSIAQCFATRNQTHQVQEPIAPVQEQKSQLDMTDNLATGPMDYTVEQSTTDEYSGLPKALVDLMMPSHVTVNEIQTVVSKKGYYPMDTPIVNYDQSFIDGVLIGAWDKVYDMVVMERMPF